MKVSVCVGNYAETPYCFENLDIRVYCIEELCYVLKENAFLLDVDIMNDRLIQWISESCGLGQLARELYPMVHQKGSLSAYVSMILEYTGFYQTEVIYQVSQTLKKGAGLSFFEKRKSRIDFLTEKKKYMAAILEYDKLLKDWGEAADCGKDKPEPQWQSKILHNKGVAFAGLMNYREAAECFRKAWEQDGNRDSLMAWLGAKRMGLGEEDYISFAAGLPQCFEASISLEKELEELSRKWEEEPDCQRLKQRQEWRNGSSKQKYYEEDQRLTQALKDSYRICVGE